MYKQLVSFLKQWEEHLLDNHCSLCLDSHFKLLCVTSQTTGKEIQPKEEGR